jgi:putative flavoprotein involved in K+ transport
MPSTDTVVIGGGQAGIAMSAMLKRRGVDHVVLERDSIAAAWRSRWDSFTLVTPNWTVQLPGAEYDGPEPDGFMPRDDIVAHIERYARSIGAPVRIGIEATEVTWHDGGYRVTTTDGQYDARSVVVATGTFQRPKRPNVGAFPSDILELHSSDYRNPDQLPPGGVLVVGSGQSGAQLAEELHEAGRRVFLTVGSAGRIPRRYRGRDIMRWADAIGFYDRPASALDSPKARFEGNPHVSGKHGGHTLNLHRFARDGIVLLGRLTAAADGRARLAHDLPDNLTKADTLSREFRAAVDRHIAEQHIGAPSPDESNTDEYAGLDGFDQPILDELDLRREEISTVLWSAGYAFDFSWVRPAALDDWGYPVQARGVTDSPGLYFLGLHFLDRFKSGLLYGVGDDAVHIADHIADHITGRV